MGLICLGIESTAHTFSVAVVSEEGEILGLSNDTYLPTSGGLKPGDVVEHHYACFESVLQAAITEAKIPLADVNLIAFSQGPGLGPVLRMGAAIARTLALKLKIPIVGVNHCIAHIEIGRLLCQVEDPVTLYVSGGNTIISAFESSRYQVFGETLDLPIGNMLDMVAREIGIPHPGGPQIEKIAKEGSQYYPFPYIVKGMDLSFSGLFSAIRAKFHSKSSPNTSDSPHYSKNDLIFSLQETSFAMLTEVFERAIAHTEKHSVLLTGGVAANKRLQEMIRYVSNEHGIPFNVVPLRLAGDNGAMIAWAGLLRFQHEGAMDIEQTRILPKWRLDETGIPWRKDLDQNQKEVPHPLPSDVLLPDSAEFSGTLLRKGAEAVILEAQWFEKNAIIKYRIPKRYRIQALDDELRTRRTLLETRTLLNLHRQEFPVPLVYEIDPSQGIIIMQKIPGLRLKDRVNSLSDSVRNAVFYEIGQWIARMHLAMYVHGDLTTSNIIYTPHGNLFFIDFGLSMYSNGIEDHAMDLHLFKRVLSSTHGLHYPKIYEKFIQGYHTERGQEGLEIINRVATIELRGRYVPKEKRRKKK